jgi:NAD-dependent DNA ligase
MSWSQKIMTLTAEELIENVKALPKSEREKIFDWIEEEKNKEAAEKKEKEAKLKADNEKFKKAMEWVDEHKEEFDGKFVVLDGDKLIASGTDSKTVYDEAKAKGYKSPFLKRVKAKELPFGGW